LNAIIDVFISSLLTFVLLEKALKVNAMIAQKRMDEAKDVSLLAGFLPLKAIAIVFALTLIAAMTALITGAVILHRILERLIGLA